MAEFDDTFFKELNRVGKGIQEMVSKVTPLFDEEIDFVPACDILENDEKYLIVLDLPGMKKTDVKISLANNVITISGERKTLELADEVFETQRKERTTGAFSRAFALPREVSRSAIQAKFELGLLKITLPKAEEINSNDIPID